MIDRFLEQRKALEDIEDTGNSSTRLTESEWVKLECLKSLLQPCKVMTTQLGGQKYVTASIVLPLYAHLRKVMEANVDDAGYASRFKETMREQLDSRFSTLSMFMKLATVLDPRFRSLKCVSKEERPLVWDRIVCECATLLEGTVESEGEGAALAVSSSSSVFCFGGDSDSDDERTPITLKVKSEQIVNAYRSHTRVSDVTDPLAWWKIHGAAFKPLDKLARKYLAIPATSVPSERLFSNAGDIVSKDRASLLPENVNMLVCLNNWL